MSLPEEWTWKEGPGGLGALWKGRTLTSCYDPHRDAVRKAERLSDAALYVLFGWGTGHLARALVHHRPNSLVVAVEPHPGRAAAARQHPDWREEVERLVLWETDEVPYAWMAGFPHSRIHLTLHPGLEAEPDLIHLMRSSQVFLDRHAVNHRTLERFARLWGRNARRNLALEKGETAQPWAKALVGRSVAIAAAGPSLEEALDQLAALPRDSFTLIAVDSAVGALAARGFRADLVVSMDAQYWNARHLDALQDETLVVELVSQPSVIRRHRGRVVIVGSSIPVVADLEQGRFPRLASGGSVATAAATFASFLGASRILWLGLDLSWFEGRTHARPGLADTLLLSRSGRLEPADSLLLAQTLSQIRVPIPSLDGERLRVDQRHSLYALWLDEAAQSGLIPPGERLLPRTTLPRFPAAASVRAFFEAAPSGRLIPPPRRPLPAARLPYEAIRALWFDWRAGRRAAFPEALVQTWADWLGPVHAARQRYRLPDLDREWEVRCAIVDSFFDSNDISVNDISVKEAT